MSNTLTPLERLPAESRKQQIVETVLELVAAHGAEAVSFQLIADRIGVTQPAVLRHFPTKEALWLAVMEWLEEHLVGIYASVDKTEEAALVMLSGIFLQHIRLIERYPALAKLVLSDHLRLQFPSLQARFGTIHKGYMARLSAILDRAKAEGAVSETVDPKDAATMFLGLVQGLGFQFAIARVQRHIQPEAERSLAFYLQGLMSGKAATDRAWATIEAVKVKAK